MISNYVELNLNWLLKTLNVIKKGITIMKLRTLFSILVTGHIILFMLIAMQIIDLKTNTKKTKDLQSDRFFMIQKTDELRHTSDDLTRHARMYAVTMDKKYKEVFFRIIYIRNGDAPRPFEYEGIYWDLLEPLRSLRHPNEEKISLYDEIIKLPFTEYEINKLHEAEKNSNTLISTETQAFNDIDKILQNNHKNDYNKAIQLLHSESYLKAKQDIMFPIEECRSSLTKRMKNQLDVFEKKVDKNIYTIYFLLTLEVLMIIGTFVILRQKISSMIRYFD